MRGHVLRHNDTNCHAVTFIPEGSTMNIEWNIMAAIETILEKADEIAQKQSDPLITSKVESWHSQYNTIKLNIEDAEAKTAMGNLLNEMSPTVDQWERGNFSQK